MLLDSTFELALNFFNIQTYSSQNKLINSSIPSFSLKKANIVPSFKNSHLHSLKYKESLQVPGRKSLGYYENFTKKFQSEIIFHDKSKNKSVYKKNKILNYEDSPVTRKQKQLEEFNLNLKLNRISKHGKPKEDKIKIPILNQKLRRRLENSKMLPGNKKESR